MITRDFSVISMTSQASLSLSPLLTKVTHAQYRKRYRASYNIGSATALPIIDSWPGLVFVVVPFSAHTCDIISGLGDFLGLNCERRTSIPVGVSGTNVWSEFILLGP